MAQNEGNLPQEVIDILKEEPGRKIQAIKKLRELTGAGLKEAKDAVEDYMNETSDSLILKVVVKEYAYLYVKDALLKQFGVISVERM